MCRPPPPLVHLTSTLTLAMTMFTSPVFAASPPPPIQFTRFASASAFSSGVLGDLALDADKLIIAPGAASGTWVSPPIEPGFPFTRLVASWNADTPADGRMRVAAQVTTDPGETSDWYALGSWAADDHAITRTSINGQADALGKVDTDTLSARADTFKSYTLRVDLERARPEDRSPTVRLLGGRSRGIRRTPRPLPRRRRSAATRSSCPCRRCRRRSTRASTRSGAAAVKPGAARPRPRWSSSTGARGRRADDLAWVDPRTPIPASISPRARPTTRHIAAPATGRSTRPMPRASASTRS